MALRTAEEMFADKAHNRYILCMRCSVLTQNSPDARVHNACWALAAGGLEVPLPGPAPDSTCLRAFPRSAPARAARTALLEARLNQALLVGGQPGQGGAGAGGGGPGAPVQGGPGQGGGGGNGGNGGGQNPIVQQGQGGANGGGVGQDGGPHQAQAVAGNLAHQPQQGGAGGGGGPLVQGGGGGAGAGGGGPGEGHAGGNPGALGLPGAQAGVGQHPPLGVDGPVGGPAPGAPGLHVGHGVMGLGPGGGGAAFGEAVGPGDPAGAAASARAFETLKGFFTEFTAVLSGMPPGAIPTGEELRSNTAPHLQPFAAVPAISGLPSMQRLAAWARCAPVGGVPGGVAPAAGLAFGAYVPPVGDHRPESIAMALTTVKGLISELERDLRALKVLAAEPVPARDGREAPPRGGAGGAAAARVAVDEAEPQRVFRLPGCIVCFPADGVSPDGVKSVLKRTGLVADLFAQPALLLRRLGGDWDTAALMVPGFIQQLAALADINQLTASSTLISLAQGRFPDNPLELLPTDKLNAVQSGRASASAASWLGSALASFVSFQKSVFSDQEQWTAEFINLLPMWEAALNEWSVPVFTDVWAHFHRSVFSALDLTVINMTRRLPPGSSIYTPSFEEAARHLALPKLHDMWSSASIRATWSTAAPPGKRLRVEGPAAGGASSGTQHREGKGGGSSAASGSVVRPCFKFQKGEDCDQSTCQYDHVTVVGLRPRQGAYSKQHGGGAAHNGSVKQAGGTRASTAGPGSVADGALREAAGAAGAGTAGPAPAGGGAAASGAHGAS